MSWRQRGDRKSGSVGEFHMQSLCGRGVIHIDSKCRANYLVGMETLLLLMAACAGLLFWALHKRDYWMMTAIAAVTVGASVHAFFAGAWPIGAIEAAWVILLARRASSVARSQSSAPSQTRPRQDTARATASPSHCAAGTQGRWPR
jgi:hypothetical protein